MGAIARAIKRLHRTLNPPQPPEAATEAIAAARRWIIIHAPQDDVEAARIIRDLFRAEARVKGLLRAMFYFSTPQQEE